MTLGIEYLRDARLVFRKSKEMADTAIARVSEEQLFARLDPESNSIALVMKHLGGNLRSRFTDFLTTDGEKPDRDRDREFALEAEDTPERIAAQWETGWRCLFDTIDALEADDLQKTVLIRTEPHLVVQAINRALAHCAYHVGQVVFLAKHFRSADWQSLSIPRGQSTAFNQKMGMR